MINLNRVYIALAILLLIGMSCLVTSSLPASITATSVATQADTPTPLLAIPVQPGQANPHEPTSIYGDIPYSSPFFFTAIAEPFVMLEDQAGFVNRDRDFVFSLVGQALGPITVVSENSLSYQLALPAVPQGTFVDVDNDGNPDKGVQIFAVAFWSNTWGGPFLELRDGTGWSNAYASTITDHENEDEIKGGTLIVWAPDEQQGFPTGFGADDLLFTSDDPTTSIPAGYNIVNLDQEPFQIYKSARQEITLIEGPGEINDFSEMNYNDTFDALFSKLSIEYPFTVEKHIDWQALYNRHAPLVAQARNSQDFYRALRDFSFSIPDGHVKVNLDPQVLYEENGGGFGLVLSELSNGRVLVSEILNGLPAAQAGIQEGAEIITWAEEPVSEAISKVIPPLGPYSTDHALRLAQTIFLSRVPPETSVQVKFKNPGQTQAQYARLVSTVEYDSLFKALNEENDPLLPIEADILQSSGLGYIKVNTFLDDSHLTAVLWDRYIKEFIDQEVDGIIIDLRNNNGGDSGMANDFAAYFFDKELVLFRTSAYNQEQGKFVYSNVQTRIKPGPLYFEGPIAILIGPDCISACEGFAYTLSLGNRSILIGHYPTAGAYGGVGFGQYKLPEGVKMQFPTSRSETMDGKLVIEGTGVSPDILVPITETTVLGQQDGLLEAAIKAILDKIQ